MQNQEITTRRFETPALEAFFKQLLGWREVGEQCAPGADFGLACTLHNNVKVLFEGGQQ